MSEREHPALADILKTFYGEARYTGASFITEDARHTRRAIAAIRDLLAAAEPGLDELLDSVHPEATIDTLLNYDDGTWAVTIVHPIKPTGSYGQSLTSKIVAYSASGPTRTAAVQAAVAKARKGAGR